MENRPNSDGDNIERDPDKPKTTSILDDVSIQLNGKQDNSVPDSVRELKNLENKDMQVEEAIRSYEKAKRDLKQEIVDEMMCRLERMKREKYLTIATKLCAENSTSIKQ